MRKIRDNNRLLKKMRRRHKVCHEHFEKNREEFMKLRRNFLFFKVLTILIVIFIIAYIFHVTGFEAIAFFLAGMIVAIEIINIFIYDKFNKKILRPVKALKDGMLKVADGDYTVRVENNARNEIGTLIDEFNNMIEKLEESRKLKKEYEKNRKDLIANISHDLKTPITSIKGYVDIICDGQIEDEQKIDRYLEIVKNNCDYMNNLIDDLFLFSKLDMQ
ncbi:MAG: histidine kinase dimerization/phospho-acceptor domain-containing protein, partial [Sarcina sp.]